MTMFRCCVVQSPGNSAPSTFKLLPCMPPFFLSFLSFFLPPPPSLWRYLEVHPSIKPLTCELYFQLFKRFIIMSFFECIDSSSRLLVSKCYELLLAESSSKGSNSTTHEIVSMSRDDLASSSSQVTDLPIDDVLLCNKSTVEL
jgi:hypothetical protein